MTVTDAGRPGGGRVLSDWSPQAVPSRATAGARRDRCAGVRGGRGWWGAPAPGASARGGGSPRRLTVLRIGVQARPRPTHRTRGCCHPQPGRGAATPFSGAWAAQDSPSDGCDVPEPWARKRGPRSGEAALESPCPPHCPGAGGPGALSGTSGRSFLSVKNKQDVRCHDKRL